MQIVHSFKYTIRLISKKRGGMGWRGIDQAGSSHDRWQARVDPVAKLRYHKRQRNARFSEPQSKSHNKVFWDVPPC